MQEDPIFKYRNFYCVGLSYKKANATLRGKFNLGEDAIKNLFQQETGEDNKDILVISTCNRTEIYSSAANPFKLIQLLCENSKGTIEELQDVVYVYKNNEAIHHLFRVGTGLDSQILGDFEIISQIKKALQLSKTYNVVNTFCERLINAVIHASKRIKNETEISSGATSVAFASVQYILSHVEHISDKNILLFGTGKIGRNTCDNLIKHTNNEYISLINRTQEKAEQIATKFHVKVKDYANLTTEINESDILIVATGAQQPTVTKEMISKEKDLLILDLSIPKNVSENVQELSGVRLIHLDYLSQITDHTINQRQLQIPKAEVIINDIQNEFVTWLETRKFAPTIKALKQKLERIKLEEIDFQRKKNSNFNEEQAEILSNRIIQKITKHFANHLKDDSTSSRESMELISKVFQLEKID